MEQKWMSLSLSDTEKILNTSAASGLSRKAARLQLGKEGRNTFFLSTQSTPRDCLRAVLFQPSAILLLILGILSLLFQPDAQSKWLFILILIHHIVIILIRLQIARISKIPERAARPMVRVIREGQLFVLDSSRLVPGDLIELEQGDIAPCDLRLVGSQSLCTQIYLGNGDGHPSYTRTSKKGNDDGIPFISDITLQSNMIHGGSLIEQGFSRALVVETGRNTYIGALQGGYPISPNQTLPGTVEKMKKTASVLQTALLLATIPIMCLSLLIGKNSEGLPVLFATLLCLCIANLSGNLDTMLNFGMAIGVHRAQSSSQDHGNIALIKTNLNPDRITDIDYLLLCCSVAFSKQEKNVSSNVSAIANTDSALPVQHRSSQTALCDLLSKSAEEQIEQLRNAGIQPVLIIAEESRYAVTDILKTGLVENEQEIARASVFHKKQLSITSDPERYHAYCGFSNVELTSFIRYLQTNHKKVAVLGSSAREYPLLKQADIRFIGLDDIRRFTDSPKINENRPLLYRPNTDFSHSQMHRFADILISGTDRNHGGIASVLNTLYIASDTTYNLINMVRYLICTQLVRTMFILPTLLMGIHMINPLQIAFSGMCLDLLFACLLLLREGKRIPEKIRTKHPLALKWLITEASCAICLTMLAFWGIYAHSPDTASASSALFLSMLSLQITFFLRCQNIFSGWKTASIRKTALTFFFICMLFLPTARIFGLFSTHVLGAISAPYGYLIPIGPISAILTALVIKLYRSPRLH